MIIKREFVDANRYHFDAGQCSFSNGWAQVDSPQDAWYYGVWANPTTLQVFSYVEGDCILCSAESPEEFAAEVRRIDGWNREHQGKGIMLDTFLKPDLDAAFVALGLADYLYQEQPQ
jgi:hypothetical protein